MTVCTCGATAKDTEADEAEDVEVEADTSEALDEPVLVEDVDKEDDLVKDLEDTLLKLKEVLAYLEDMAGGDEKQEEDEDEEEAEEEPAAEEEEEEKAEPAEKVDDLEKAIRTLKKHGLNIYAGKKRTPAPKRSTPKPTNWTEFSKSLDEVDRLVEKAGGGY
jgi:TolA-binding protein